VDETRQAKPSSDRAKRRLDAERQLRAWGAQTGVHVSILRAPGIYAAGAYSAKYGEPFRTVIREPYSYLENDVVPILKEYRGRLLLVVGEYDGLEPAHYGKPAGTAVGDIVIGGVQRYSPIPRDVIELIYNALPAAQCQLLTVPGADHAVVPWIRNHPEVGATLLNEIAEFLSD